MKKAILLLISITLLFCACSQNDIYTQTTVKDAGVTVKEDYVKSIWFTYYELSSMIKGKSENEFKKSINSAFKKVSNMGFNTVTVQVRPFADAFYPSEYFPSSEYVVEHQGENMDYDPLKIMCETAAKYSLNIEAWINPYRVSSDNDINKLAESNIARKWFGSKKTKSRVYITKSGIYFNPASEEVTKLIVNGVREIVENYPVNAIHFDDYFYPTTNENIDKNEYKKYKDKISLAEFRRNKVNGLIKSVYKVVKESNSAVKFGISPAADIIMDKNELYADVELWATEDGYCDYICPQVYFGFRNVYKPFMFTVKKWIGISSKDLYIGLPLYKAGKPDKYAADNDKSIINEFRNNDNIIERQITYLSKIDEVKGFYIFSYSSLSDEKCKAEVENMLKVMQ